VTFLGGLAIVLLALVGYCGGASSVSGRRQPVPFLVDIPILLVLWTGAFALAPRLGHWQSVIAAFLGSFAASAAVTLVRRRNLPPASRPKGHIAPAGGPGHRLLEGWKSWSRRLGNYQGRLILAFFYFTVLIPFALVVKVFSDPLSLRVRAGWADRKAGAADVDSARMQF
jgi:hypothetical protein